MPARVLAGAVLLSGCAAGPADLAPASRDLRGQSAVDLLADGGAAPNRTPEGYVYVTRRLHVSMGLAEARGLGPTDTTRLVEFLASEFEGCAKALEEAGKLSSGAARLVVLLDASGRITGLDVKVAPGGQVAADALQCLAAPARAFPYPRGEGSRRGFALEASWEPARGRAAAR